MNTNKLLTKLVLIFVSAFGFSQNVSNQTELDTAISEAVAGTVISIQDGTYANLNININNNSGTIDNPIRIIAENNGSVFLEGASRALLSGAHIELSGFIFENPSGLAEGQIAGDDIDPVIRLNDCNSCLIQNIKIDSYNISTNPDDDFSTQSTFKWILNDGQYNEISYCSFVGKNGIGSIINDNRNSIAPDYLTIHHNYFADRVPAGGIVNDKNNQDAIRMGNSASSLDDSFSEVYDNYFYNFFGEIEIISNKSGNNKYYNNTFRNYSGSLTLRHGNECEVYGNYFFAEGNEFSGGVRVIGERHKIYNNYIEAVNSNKSDGTVSNALGGVNVTNGRQNTEINGYYRVIDTQIVNNTFVDCDYGVRVGTKVKTDLEEEPINLTVANNIMYNSSIDPFQIVTPASGVVISEGNLDNLTASELVDDGNFFRIVNGSSAIDAAIGSYSFLQFDILDGVRSSSLDVGAEEYNGQGASLPYTNLDVDNKIGFGAIATTTPALRVLESDFKYKVEGGSSTFEINSNVDWEITNIPSWITLSATFGVAGNITITLTVGENTTAIDRMETLEINEVYGGNNLSTAVTVFQSDGIFDPENPEEIKAEEATAVGTQVDDLGQIENGPEKTINDLLGDRWSAESSDGSAYLTYNLGCIRELTTISIYFHKSTERTTQFILATSIDGVNYTNETDSPISSVLQTDGADYQDFDLNLQAKYIRIFGYGNSVEGSDWNSIEEVKFYGNENCDTTLSNEDFENLKFKGVSLYPTPVINGELMIESSNFTINRIEIYNIIGQKVMTSNAENEKIKLLDVSGLNSGVYFIVLEDIGVSKFVIQ